jgi:predicted transcriptional regulator
MDSVNNGSIIQLTAEIVSAFVTNNKIEQSELRNLIEKVHLALVKAPAAAAEPEKPNLVPAVPIKKSVTPDYIISLEDGKKFKSLKRHLMGSYGLTPEEYRAKWGLPRDYPMVAPNYAKARSDLAKKMGLGRKSGSEVPARRVAKPRKRSAKQAA